VAKKSIAEQCRTEQSIAQHSTAEKNKETGNLKQNPAQLHEAYTIPLD